MVKKPWSITTTLRNPDRLRGFLTILKKLDNSSWDKDSQKKFQVLLLQGRLYGYGSSQFYKFLSQKQVDLIKDPSKKISYKQAEEIFEAKGYEDPPMRGRQSLNPLKKYGFARVEDGKLKITKLGQLFLEKDFDLGEIFLRSFLKWQIPNPHSRGYPQDGIYDVKPFIGTLHLIKSVNQKEKARGKKPKGISKREFSLFVPTLVNYKDINKHAEAIISLRGKLENKNKSAQQKCWNSFERKFTRDLLGSGEKGTGRVLSNLRDYGDNTIRYFRLTRYIYIRGNGFYVDLEPRRSVEINSLLEYDNARAIKFESKEQYASYISDITLPKLPWETKEKYLESATMLIEEINKHEQTLDKPPTVLKDLEKMPENKLGDYIKELRSYRKELQDEIEHKNSQAIEKVEEYIERLESIFDSESRPILLEKLSALGLQALNDAIKIHPNYPVGDDNEPTFTAPSNVPDIECFYQSFNAICEVTMLTNRSQWFNEGQPVMRHLRDFEHKNKDKQSYCLFIAPQLHRDTLNTFWTSVKYEYEGQQQKIVPITISQFVSILKILRKIKKGEGFLKHSEIHGLLEKIVSSSQSCKSSEDWRESIPKTISEWGEEVIGKV